MQRLDLRKFCCNGIQHRDNLVLVVVSETNCEHYVADLIVSDNDISKETGILPDVVELEVMSDGVFPDEKPDLI